MEEHTDEKIERTETREIEVDTMQPQDLDVVEIERAPLTDLNFGF